MDDGRLESATSHKEYSTSPPQKELKENILTVRKPEGLYTFILSNHNESQNPNEIPSGISTLGLETGYYNFVNKNSENVLEALEETEQYKDIIKMVKDKRLTILLPDSRPHWSAALMVEPTIQFLELAAGTTIGAKALIDVWDNSYQRRRQKYFPDKTMKQKYSRRDFLKLGAKGIVSAWLSTPFITNFLDTHPSGLPAEINKAARKTNPQEALQHLLIITARNVLIAHKEQAYMQTRLMPEHMATVIGAGHYEIGDLLLNSPEKRLEYLRSIKPLLKIAFPDETFFSYSTIAFKQSPEGVVLQKNNTEIPELKSLVE